MAPWLVPSLHQPLVGDLSARWGLLAGRTVDVGGATLSGDSDGSAGAVETETPIRVHALPAHGVGGQVAAEATHGGAARPRSGAADDEASPPHVPLLEDAEHGDHAQDDQNRAPDDQAQGEGEAELLREHVGAGFHELSTNSTLMSAGKQVFETREWKRLRKKAKILTSSVEEGRQHVERNWS